MYDYLWDECPKHAWLERYWSPYTTEDKEEVYCMYCGIVGEMDIKTGEVYYPAT